MKPMMLGMSRFLRLELRSRGMVKACQVHATLPNKTLIPSLVGSVRGISSTLEGMGTETEDSSRYETIKVFLDSGVRTIIFNRPNKKNAISEKMFEEIPKALAVAAQDPQTMITATAGAGNVYCAGNDKSNFRTITMTQSRDLLISFFASYIDFPKPIVALVDGAAVGAATTTLPLHDVVYATEKAVFFTPFSALDITAEGCSTFTFPRLMGQAKASEILYFNKRIGATEAEKLGLVTEVLSHATFMQDVKPKLLAMAELPLKSLVYSKQLCREPVKDILHKVNIEECKRVTERFSVLCKDMHPEYEEYVKQNW